MMRNVCLILTSFFVSGATCFAEAERHSALMNYVSMQIFEAMEGNPIWERHAKARSSYVKKDGALSCAAMTQMSTDLRGLSDVYMCDLGPTNLAPWGFRFEGQAAALLMKAFTKILAEENEVKVLIPGIGPHKLISRSRDCTGGSGCVPAELSLWPTTGNDRMHVLECSIPKRSFLSFGGSEFDDAKVKGFLKQDKADYTCSVFLR